MFCLYKSIVNFFMPKVVSLVRCFYELCNKKCLSVKYAIHNQYIIKIFFKRRSYFVEKFYNIWSIRKNVIVLGLSISHCINFRFICIQTVSKYNIKKIKKKKKKKTRMKKTFRNIKKKHVSIANVNILTLATM